MSLKIKTFSNLQGGECFFKALGHPLVPEKARVLIEGLGTGSVAVYDPLGLVEGFAEFYGLKDLDIRNIYVQKFEDVGKSVLGFPARAVIELKDFKADTLLVAAFDAKRLIDHIRHLIPQRTEIVSFDAIRLPDTMLSNRKRYLDPLNFATNFGFLRDAGGLHTRIVTADYWSGWGAAEPPEVWFCLFDQHGEPLARWQDALPAAGASLTIDSRDIRKRFGLGDFAGSLFMHVIGATGHEVVKYALDVYGDDPTVLSCTHDANAWPSDLFAGLPAPDTDETVVLWIQNSHPVRIPKGGVGLNLMGSEEVRWLDIEIAPFACHALDVADLLPDARWPQQIEVRAGRYFVRPRYEVSVKNGRSRIAHANVERNDLSVDPGLASVTDLLGKSHILPAPILPVIHWDSVLQPTPMSTAQRELPIAAIVYDASGQEVARQSFGKLKRDAAFAFDINAFLEKTGNALPSGYGHVELVYDFSEGGEADGWLHGLFRYRQKSSGHVAETSFGSHLFNTVLTYKNEPQSYAAQPPGLSTRLFLRLGDEPLDTFCQLIYPTSGNWHPSSSTTLTLFDRHGQMIAAQEVRIPCSGSLLWRYREIFDRDARAKAGPGAYVIIRDSTCRLFGYHGTIDGDTAFCLDHMFGF